MTMPAAPRDLEDIELDLLLEALHQRFGYDFGGYARASLRRRVQNLLIHTGVANISQLTERVLHGGVPITEVVDQLSVPVSEFFRDPPSFATMLRLVFPLLASYPHINVWQAGCARGEEVYSLAILLEEAGLYERTRIWATDISEKSLALAREGIYPARELPQYADSYRLAGGRHSFSDYFHARYGHIKLDDALKRNVTFAPHNLAADGVFCETQLILCRNVLIYFQPPLQQRALALFADSLVRGGFLCLGEKESMSRHEIRERFTLLDRRAALYRRNPSAHG
ncbi:CheR family methyltransferase [Sinimarinibacterium thermocellulolyticum]|uniref:Protein-glutamate O-methyltransferase CheR n=1 Tax=Sinimarinibacterium thermocellulolyticum TaxID=3170016 RepID=A0ABV2AAQ9_9GAMM